VAWPACPPGELAATAAVERRGLICASTTSSTLPFGGKLIDRELVATSRAHVREVVVQQHYHDVHPVARDHERDELEYPWQRVDSDHLRSRGDRIRRGTAPGKQRRHDEHGAERAGGRVALLARGRC
jgi:hypothetical protein